MKLMHVALMVASVALLAHQYYNDTWRAAIETAGQYERRSPGEFAKDSDKYSIVSLKSNWREFQFLPPAPQKPGLIKFTNPTRGTLYIDGLPAAEVYVGVHGGCDVIRIGADVYTKVVVPV